MKCYIWIIIFLMMKKGAKIQTVSTKAIRHANAKLMKRGIVVKGRSAVTGSITVKVERGTLSHKRVISSEEMNDAYKLAMGK